MRQVLIIDCEVVTLPQPGVRQCEACHRMTPNVDCPVCAPGDGLMRRFGHNNVAAICRAMVPEHMLRFPHIDWLIYNFAERTGPVTTRDAIRARFRKALMGDYQ